MKTKDTISSCSKPKDVHAIKYKMSKSKERCMEYFRSFHSYLQVLSKEDLKGTRIEHGFKQAFMSLFGQDNDTFTSTMLLNIDQLQKQLDKDEFQEDGSMATFWVINRQIDVKQFRETLLQHMSNVKKSVAERTRHKRLYDRRVNKRQMQKQESKVDTGKALDADLVVTERNGTKSEVQDNNNRPGNDTDADDADIRLIYDEELMAEVQLTTECNIFAIGQRHTEQPKIINEGRVDQYPEQCQVKSPIIEAHCIALELKYQNHALKLGQHGQILNEASNKAKMKKEIDAFETINIELKHSVATLLKENETLKKHYKDLYDSIKITRSKTIEHTTSLLANNADLKDSGKEEDRKKTQERNRNSKSNVMHTASPQNTTNDHKPKSRSNNQTSRSLHVSKISCVTSNVVRLVDHSRNSSPFSDSKHFVCSTCQKCIFNANHDACITKLMKEVNSRAKIQSHKTRNSNKPVDQKSHTQKFGRQIFTGHMFSPNKTSDVYEKTSPRSDLRWKPIGIILKYVGLRWIPTENLFDSCTGKVDSEPPHGTNGDISKIHFGSLFSPLFDEHFNGEKQVVSKSSAVTTADASDKRQQQPDSTSSTSTLTTTVTADGNFDV
ncbi:hypothetical protein Tco_1207278 [Tanacetum coccineum]